ncbi:MAG: Outer membrane protein assembly factor BamB [Phycisphaerae bacterium]|nr:Outer membrane protein assembly factor BamB [Phycisphaerae bacterium]
MSFQVVSRQIASASGFVMSLIVLSSAPTFAGDTDWTQWGGPKRDFVCRAAKNLATAWPESGPERLWSREIGDGYSSILIEDGVLYTMCRRGESDAVLALESKSGKTLWETTYDAPTRPGQNLAFGPGPHATPLLVGDRIITSGATLKINCLDKKTGKMLWSHDLYDEMEGDVLMFGYGPSPTAYKDLVIITVPVRGGPPPSPDNPLPAAPEPKSFVAAFKQSDGSKVWTSEKFTRIGHPSPLVVTIGGVEQLLMQLGGELVGMDPATGKTLWKLTLSGDKAGFAMSTPQFGEDGVVVVSAAYGAGTWAAKVEKTASGFEAKELWFNKYLRVQHGSFVRVGDYVYGSSGDFGPALLMCVDVRTGETRWRERGFAKANCMLADGKLIILDENGDLAIADPSPEGLKVRCRANILTHQAWTVPTIIGSTMYVRDRKTIMALELGGKGAPVG